MVHGFFTCEYCKKIVLVFALKDAFEESSEGIRFNQMLTFMRRLVDSKMAAPTLVRHLKYLRRGGIIKRTQKGIQNVTYSLKSDNPLISKDDLKLSRKWLDDHKERFCAWNLRQIVDNILFLSRLLELESILIYLQKSFTDEKPEILAFKLEFKNALYQQYGILLHDAIKEKKAEYREVKNLLEGEIGDLKKILFTGTD